MDPLPHRQQQLLELIATDARQGRTPVIGELIRALGLARESSLTTLLNPLQRKGVISIEGGIQGRHRIITLTPRGKMLAGLGLPVVGCITAGHLREAIAESEEWIDTANGLLPHRAGDFLLCVEGDSMIGDGILHGDKVLLRPDVEVSNGEIAAVQIAGGADGAEDGSYCATLKHVHFRPGGKTMQLRASNPQYEELSVPADKVFIAGVYRGLVRTSQTSGSQ
jgi:repressor LexA